MYRYSACVRLCVACHTQGGLPGPPLPCITENLSDAFGTRSQRDQPDALCTGVPTPNPVAPFHPRRETGLTHLYTIEANYNTARCLNVVPPASGDHGGRASPPCSKRFPPKFTAGILQVGRWCGCLRKRWRWVGIARVLREREHYREPVPCWWRCWTERGFFCVLVRNLVLAY